MSLLIALVLAGPIDWLPAAKGYATLAPGDWARVLEEPTSITVELLRDLTDQSEAPKGPWDTRFEVIDTRVHEGRATEPIRRLLRTPSTWKVQDQSRCRPRRCIFVMLCGGFRPGLRLRAERNGRTIELEACLDCEEVWLRRIDLDGRATEWEQALIDGDRWRTVFSPR